MVDVAQSVRALDCGSRCRGFESHLPPQRLKALPVSKAFLFDTPHWQISCIIFTYIFIEKYNRRFMHKMVSIPIFMLIFAIQKNKQEVKQLKSIKLC